MAANKQAGEKRKIVVGLTEERGGAALETGLLLAVSAACAFTVKAFIANPLLGSLTRAVRAIGQALS